MAWQNLGNIQKPLFAISNIQQLGWVTMLLHSFQQDICSQYQTFDLPSEEAAWARRKAAAAKKDGIAAKKDQGKGSAAGSRKLWKFNLNTFKTHVLGGYAKAIRLFGSPDSYNSQLVSNFTVISC